MPIVSGLNLASGLNGVRPRPAGGIGLAQPVASTSSIMAPSAAPVAPRQQPLALPQVAAPAPPPVPQPTAESGGGESMNIFSKIGLLLSNVAAGMEGRPLPSDMLEQARLKREELRMNKDIQSMNMAIKSLELLGQVPGDMRDQTTDALVKSMPGGGTDFTRALLAGAKVDPEKFADAYPIVGRQLVNMYNTSGLDAVQSTLDSPEKMKALRERAVDGARESAKTKMDQVVGLIQNGVKSGAVSPDVAQAVSGTMTVDRLMELNKSLPDNMKFQPAEVAALGDYGYSGFGATILPKDTAAKVAEAEALRPGKMSEYEEQQRLQQKYNPSEGSDGPSTVQEWNFYEGLTPEKKQEFLRMKRGDRVVDVGGSIINVTPGVPGSAEKVADKTLAPADQPENAASKALAVDTAKMQVEKQTKFPKAQAAIVALEQQNDVVISAIDEALANVSSISAGFGSMIAGVPTTQAKALQASLDTIKANIGFDKLQDMRNNSPTGGALGPVSDTENKLLSATVRSLDQGLDPAALKKNLEFIKQNIADLRTQRRAAFESDFAGFGTEKAPAPPTKTPASGGIKFLGFE